MTTAPSGSASPLHAFISARTGMALSGPQRRRLEERLAQLRGARGEPQYLLHLQSPAGAAELAELMAAVAVHKTDLFRDEVQLEAFQAHVLGPLVARAGRPLRVWSAGCATGEEVATLLVLLAEAGADPASTVLGTDLCEPAVARARLLRFGEEQLRRVPPALRERYFVPQGPAGASLVSALRERAWFRPHNLMDLPYPVPEGGGGFDIIFCRNVLIYFTPEAFEGAVTALAERLAPGGTLVLSAAEPLLHVPSYLRALRSESAFFYERAPDEPPPAPRRPDSGRFPAMGADAGIAPTPAPRPRWPDSGRFPSVEPSPLADEASHAQAAALFALVLEGSGASEGGDARTEEALRRCLALDPDLAAARFLLGMMLELRDARAEAAQEFRRALRSLEEGRARAVPFFLNLARLRVACARAVERTEEASRIR